MRRCTKSWGGVQPEQLTRTGQRDLLYHSTSCPVYTEAIGREGPIAAWGQAGHWSTEGEQLYCASLVFLGFHFSFYPLFITISIIIAIINIFIIIIFYFISTLKLFLSQPMHFTSPLPQLLFSHLDREWASICVVLSCQLRLNHNKAPQEILALQSLLMKLINTWSKTELNVNDYSVKVWLSTMLTRT